MDTRLHTALPRTEKPTRLTGLAMSALFAAFMVFDTAIKVVKAKIVADTLVPLGYDPEIGFPIGIMEAITLTLHLRPRTAILGAVLLSGLFGGALAWGGLWLRDEALRAVSPVRH